MKNTDEEWNTRDFDEESDEEVPQQEEEEEYEEEEEDESGKEEGEVTQGQAIPIGEVMKVPDESTLEMKDHYNAFECNGFMFKLDDPVLVCTEIGRKPVVAIIKEITQNRYGSMRVTCQWFYRPEKAKNENGGTWEKRDDRELFYSFRRSEIRAECCMHPCVVHFIPLHKQLPRRSQHPGFIVQRVYDHLQKKLWGLTENNQQYELNVRVRETREIVGELPDVETEEEGSSHFECHGLQNRIRRKLILAPDDDSNELDDSTRRFDHHAPSKTMAGSSKDDEMSFYMILADFDVLTGDIYRDKWLEKLLEGVQSVCDEMDIDELPQQTSHGNRTLRWPDAAVSAVVALEQVSHGALSSDFKKYNQKMRQLHFNLKTNGGLARRLVERELEASVIFNMSAKELKDGCLATEVESDREVADDSEQMQMTEGRCSRCMEKKVRVSDIIHAGRGERYQMECLECGNTWYAWSR